MSRDHSAAKKFRDVVASIARSEIEKMFPRDRYAKVHEIHEDQRRVVVQYNGEGPDNLVSVPYNSVKPAYVDQWVRIGGAAGDRHVVDTLGGTAVEARAEEVLDQAPLYPKWLQPDTRVLDTAPAVAHEDAERSLLLESGRLGGTVLRAPTTVTISGMRVFVKTGRSGSLRAALYRMQDNYGADLLAQSENVSASGDGTSKIFTFDSHVTLERGDEVLLSVLNLTSGDVSLGGWLHRQAFTTDTQNALTYHLDGLSSPPSVILGSQWSGRNSDRSWYYSAILEP